MIDLANPSALLPEPYTSGPLWHYTSQAGLIGMVENGTLWATSAAHLNDSREIRHGYKVLKAVWDRIKSPYGRKTDLLVHSMLIRARVAGEYDGAYVTCASTRRDDLSQWRAYGNYAVEIDPSVRLDIVHGQDIQGDPRYPRAWRKVIYDRAEQERAAHAVLISIANSLHGHGAFGYLKDGDGAQASTIYNGWLDALLPLLKNKGFRGEHEVRLALGFPEWMLMTKRRFRPGAYSVTPYIEITSAEEHGRLPLRSVQIGPTPHFKSARLGVDTLLTAHRYGVVDEEGVVRETLPIRRSKVPYRT